MVFDLRLLLSLLIRLSFPSALLFFLALRLILKTFLCGRRLSFNLRRLCVKVFLRRLSNHHFFSFVNSLHSSDFFMMKLNKTSRDFLQFDFIWFLSAYSLFVLVLLFKRLIFSFSFLLLHFPNISNSHESNDTLAKNEAHLQDEYNCHASDVDQ